MPNFSSLACLEVPEKFVGGGMVCTVILWSNPTVVLCCVEVGVLTKLQENHRFRPLQGVSGGYIKGGSMN